MINFINYIKNLIIGINYRFLIVIILFCFQFISLFYENSLLLKPLLFIFVFSFFCLFASKINKILYKMICLIVRVMFCSKFVVFGWLMSFLAYFLSKFLFEKTRMELFLDHIEFDTAIFCIFIYGFIVFYLYILKFPYVSFLYKAPISILLLCFNIFILLLIFLLQVSLKTDVYKNEYICISKVWKESELLDFFKNICVKHGLNFGNFNNEKITQIISENNTPEKLENFVMLTKENQTWFDSLLAFGGNFFGLDRSLTVFEFSIASGAVVGLTAFAVVIVIVNKDALADFFNGGGSVAPSPFPVLSVPRDTIDGLCGAGYYDGVLEGAEGMVPFTADGRYLSPDEYCHIATTYMDTIYPEGEEYEKIAAIYENINWEFIC